jgi:hypothetical protein
MMRNARWLRISLRSLLFATLIIAMGIGYLTNYMNRRNSAFAAIRDAGGRIRIVSEPDTTIWSKFKNWIGSEAFATVYEIDLDERKADDELLKHIAIFGELRALNLSDADIDDASLELIMHLPLTELWLQNTKITDDSAATLSKLNRLEFLALNATSLSDRFLEDLKTLPSLRILGLRGSHIEGRGLQYLSRHPKLEQLDVYSTEVDDDAVASLLTSTSIEQLGLSMTKVSSRIFEQLANFPNLSKVDLSGNRTISTDMVLEFEKSHPRCDIEWYGP